jgi:hypothetical protein
MDTLISRGWALVDMATAVMQDKGEFAMQYIVVAPDGSADVFQPPPQTANSPLLKDAMLKTLQELGRVQQPAAVLVVADAWFSQASVSVDPAELNTMRFIPLAELRRRGMVGESREVILCSIQTPIECTLLRQYYRREDGKIVLEERETVNGKEAFKGRIFRFFDGQQEAHA